MATATKNQSTPEALTALLGEDAGVADVDDPNLIKSSRGRQEGADVIALRELVRESLNSGKAKVFSNITDDKKREEITRKIRAAGKGAAEDGGDVKMSTSYNRDKAMLFWGPAEVIDKLTGKNR